MKTRRFPGIISEPLTRRKSVIHMGMTVKKAQLILEKSGNKYTEQQVIEILDKLRELADIQIQIHHENSHNLHKGFHG